MELVRQLCSIRNVGIGLATLLCSASAFSLPVIPGAAGFGIDTAAGRGGEVIRVTNLSDAGTGSFRACVSASGPRVCVFEISGQIELTSDLVISNPFITIAGQTAPAPGITVRGAGLRIHSHDVLVQHMRFRVGDAAGGPDPANRDSIGISSSEGQAYNIVLDHLSVSWGVDENMEIWRGFDNVTIRNTIVSEGLRDSISASGPRAYGVLVGPGTGKLSFLNSVLAHNTDRNIATRGNNSVVFANNVVYNWGHYAYKVEAEDRGQMTLLSNVFIKGPSHKYNGPVTIRPTTGSGFRLYVSGTVSDNCPNRLCESWQEVTNQTDYNLRANSISLSIPGFVPMDLRDDRNFQAVLDNAGARPTERDAVDSRVIRDVRNKTGQIINSPSEVGGWPALAVNRRTLSIPGNANSDDDSDGYTNLEEWLHGFSEPLNGAPGYRLYPNPPTNLGATDN